MSTGAIIAIVVVALIIVALLAFMLPRSRARSRERALTRRREEVAGAHREVAEERMARADRAERVARAERAEAERHESRAALHEDGLADDELDRDHERYAQERDTGGGETLADEPGRTSR